MECSIYQTVKHVGVQKKQIKNTVFFVLRKQKKQKSEVSVHLVGDKRMHTLNRAFRGKDKTTDVLSFATQEGVHMFDTGDLGDIFLSIPQIKRQARRFGVLYKEELFRMLIHGVLHILGYDHKTKSEASEMFGLQEKYLVEITKML